LKDEIKEKAPGFVGMPVKQESPIFHTDPNI